MSARALVAATLALLVAACTPAPSPPLAPTDAGPVAPALAAPSASGALAADPRFALPGLVAGAPPADGTYAADAIIVAVHVCHCPPLAKCKCPLDTLEVTSDAADSMSWKVLLGGIADAEARFRVGSRHRLSIRVERGEARVIGSTPL